MEVHGHLELRTTFTDGVASRTENIRYLVVNAPSLKLNPEKCVFGVEAGKFLGFLLTERGIELNPEKCAAILAMRSPISVKEVQ